MLFVMILINVVILMMRVVIVIKLIKKVIIWKFFFCLFVCLLYEIKNEKERNVRKIFNLF